MGKSFAPLHRPQNFRTCIAESPSLGWLPGSGFVEQPGDRVDRSTTGYVVEVHVVLAGGSRVFVAEMTSQALLANMAGMYAVYHGAEGLKTTATRIHRLTAILAEGLRRAGVPLLTSAFFDTVHLDLGVRAESVYNDALKSGYNLRRVAAGVLGISLDETTTRNDVATLFKLIAQATLDVDALDTQVAGLPNALLRNDAVLAHPVFNTHHTEHEMLRYLNSLQNKDLALDHSMISLGSCTMKLHATSEMIPLTRPE